MNSSLRIALLSGAHVLMAGSISAKTLNEIAPVRMVSIRLYDQAQTPPGVLRLSMEETTRVFRAAGVGIAWEPLLAESPEDQGSDMTSPAFQQTDGRGYIVLRLTRRTAASLVPSALGFALPFARTGAHVLIFYDRVEALIHAVDIAGYIVLGHAIAHEIGHVLLHSSEHSDGGLMQARWTPASWRLASAGLLGFRREEAERMSAGLEKGQARRSVPDRH